MKNYLKFFFVRHDLFTFSFFPHLYPFTKACNTTAIPKLKPEDYCNMGWHKMYEMKSHVKQKCKFTCISEKNKQTKQKKTPTSSPPQEILWRENWHLLCLAGLLHQYADRGCSCRSWLFSVWMPDKGQLHMEVPDQAWFNITCDFEQSCTEGDGTGFARHCLMKEAKLKALRTTAVVDLKAKA